MNVRRRSGGRAQRQQAALEGGDPNEPLPSCRPEPMPMHIFCPWGRLAAERVRAAIEALDVSRRRQATAAASG